MLRNMGSKFVEQRINIKYVVKLDKNVIGLSALVKLFSGSHFYYFQALKRYDEVSFIGRM
jgi:hypothetical protein